MLPHHPSANCEVKPPDLTDHTPVLVLKLEDLLQMRGRSRYSPQHPNNTNQAFNGAGGNFKPVFTMNILLSLAIFLQLYQICTNTPANLMRENFAQSSIIFPRGLRGYDEHANPNFNDFFYNPNKGATSDAEIKDSPLQFDDEERRRRNRNFILYGNEEGPPESNMAILSGAYLDPDYFYHADVNTTKATEPPFQPSKYNYSLTPVRTSWNLITTPRPATNDSNLCIVILSCRSNFDRRQAIRETWGQNQTNIFFVIGGPEPDNQEDKDWKNDNSTSNRLWREHERYGDILDTIHPDSYKALPYKLHFAIQWIGNHKDMQHIQWILKADDDVVVRPNTLRYYVLRNFNPLAAMVIGRIEPNSMPHRTGKWAEDPEWPEGTEYPPWAYGSTGYVMSRPVVQYIASQQSLYYYQGEDASLGIWLFESPLDVSWIHSRDFSVYASESYYNHKYSVVIGHDVSPANMRVIYEAWKDPKNIEDMIHDNHTKTKGDIFNLELQGRYDNYLDYHGYHPGWDDQFGGFDGLPWVPGDQQDYLREDHW